MVGKGKGKQSGKAKGKAGSKKGGPKKQSGEDDSDDEDFEPSSSDTQVGGPVMPGIGPVNQTKS